MSGINNLTAVLEGDKDPLLALGNSILQLDEEAYTNAFVGDEFIRNTGSVGIEFKDIAHNVEFLYTCHLIQRANSKASEQEFGLSMQHIIMEDEMDKNFTMVSVFEVDMSDGHTRSHPGEAKPTNSSVTVRRELFARFPLSGGFLVEKSVRDKMARAMKAYAEYYTKDGSERAAQGLPPSDDIDNPKLKVLKFSLNRFKAAINKNINWCANGKVRGDNTHTLMSMIDMSPSIYALMKHKPLRNTMDRRDLAVLLNSSFTELTFGLNKLIPLYNAERSSQLSVMHDVLNIFEIFTDANGALNEMKGYLSGSGAPFYQPDAIAVCPGRVIKILSQVGFVQTAVCDLNQFTAMLSLSDKDMSPLVTAAPQESVSIVNGVYRRNDNAGGQIVRTSNKRENVTIKYARVGEKNILFSDPDNGTFSKNVRGDSGLTTMSTYDSMVPTGVTLTEHDKVPRGPCRQSTTFCNENGVNFTLGCDMLKTFFTDFFYDPKHAVVDLNTMDNVDPDNTEDVEKSMIFYRFRKTGEEAKKGSDEEEEEEEEEDGGAGILVRNYYMTDNYYYDDDLHIQNIISAILNSTNHKLCEFTKVVSQQSTKLAPFGDDDPIPDELSDNLDDGDAGWSDSERAIYLLSQSRKKTNFELDAIVAAVQEYMSVRKMYIERKRIIAIHRALRGMSNVTAINFYGFINPGVGFLWLLPQFVQADSMLITRPSAFNHLVGKPSMTRQRDHSDESQYDQYVTETYTAVGRLSLGTNPSIFWQNCAFVKSQATATNRIVPLTDSTKMRSVINWIDAMRRSGMVDKTMVNPDIINAWWPVFCPPTMPRAFFESANSPVGRLATHYLRKDDFDTKFYSQGVRDIKFPNSYTLNPVFTNMTDNFNTRVLYTKEMVRTEDGCPLTKYLNFNPTAAMALTNMETNAMRVVNEAMNMQRQDGDRLDPRDLDNSKISNVMGAALPRTCWSCSDLAEKVLVREDFQKATSYRTNNVITSGDTSFLITGTNTQEKFERCAVSHHSFVV